MRKPIFPRILFFILIYCAVFLVLSSIQFAKKGGFTQRAGSFIVTGYYRLPGEYDPPLAPNEYLLEGDVNVFYGGMNFSMERGNETRLLILNEDDYDWEEILPERMMISGDTLLFTFPGGTELEFSTHYAGGSEEMRIYGSFPENVSSLELPFKPMRGTGIRESVDGQLIIISDGINYTFGRSQVDNAKKTLLIRAGAAAASYGILPEKKVFSPEDFILPQAESLASYNEALTRWRDQNFSLWNRTVSEQNNEDIVAALESEAIIRGTYRAAVSAVSAAFLRGSERTYESSVYLGGMDAAFRSIVAAEREKISRLSRQINDKSLEFLMEPRVFEYFAIRGYQNYIDAGAELVRTIDPAILALDIVPGLMEGYLDWKTIRPDADNPFERLIDQACFVISESLRRSGDRVFSFNEGIGDTEFNVRLGKALIDFGDDSQSSSWAAIGRSLILTALSLGDASGAVIPALAVSETGEIEDSSQSTDLTTARLYRILSPADYYPRAVPIASPQNSNTWAWTAAREINSSLQDNVLDMAVSFPAGETHYLIIRGMRPFTRIQIYNLDYRSDPQFERYDSSGWVYQAQEQTLLIKMRHRAEDELIRIFF